jgi:iron(III) transport system ATP-binding protein
LRSIAGLEVPDAGSIMIGDHRVFDEELSLFGPPNKRQIGMVFQSYAIWPHMNVFENVAFPLRVGSRLSRKEIAKRVERVLATVHLDGYASRSATKLSGGQQQRLALARSLVVEPDLLLLDEPLSNLDAKLRESMRLELRRLQQEVGITTMFVTHDQSEALAMSDEVAIMNEGEIIQIGSPEAVYNQPNSRFVASFIGSTNLLPGTVSRPPDPQRIGVVETALGSIRCAFSDNARAASDVVVSIRPESILLGGGNGAMSDQGLNAVSGRIRERIFIGEVVDCAVTVGPVELRMRANQFNAPQVNQETVLHLPQQQCIALAAN